MATEAQKRELVKKIRKLVSRKFAGNYRQAFIHYSGGQGEKVDADELSKLCKDAGIGSMLTRSMWVSGILDAVDKNADREISWNEFQEVLR